VKIARNAIFDRKEMDVAHATNIPGQKVSQGSYSAVVPAPLASGKNRRVPHPSFFEGWGFPSAVRGILLFIS